MWRNTSFTKMVHIDSSVLDCYIQEEAFVQDSHTNAPPIHLANPVCLPLVVWVAGRAAGCRATKMAPLYRSLTKRCSGPRSKQYGVRMFRGKTEVSCSSSDWAGEQQQRWRSTLPLSLASQSTVLQRETYLRRGRKLPALPAETSPTLQIDRLNAKRGYGNSEL
jgi:hypothetical protein